MTKHHKIRTNRSGATLVELMVAVVILSVGVLGLIGTFTSIQRAVQNSKNKTLASTLAQEQMQILKQKNYYQVLITTASTPHNTDYTPSIPYDHGYFPPETILQGGKSFERLTYIQVAQEDSGAIVALPVGTPDTGLKLITITTLWTQGGEKKKQTITSVLGNPNTVTANATFTGLVSNSATAAPIVGAVVTAAENMGWRDTTNSAGRYSISLSPGVFHLVASAQGYFSRFATITAVANAATDQPFPLLAMASGTITGYAWYHPDLVISQVVAATNTLCGDGANHDVEYITLFNPTTAAINIGVTGASGSKDVNIAYLDENSSFDRDDAGLKLTHVSTYVASHASYLIANATFFYVVGGWRTADAYYMPTAAPCVMALYCDVIRTTKAGGIELTHGHDGSEIDKVGWDDFDNGSPTNEGTSLNTAATDGLPDGGQVVRISSPTPAATLAELLAYGGAYDSGDNADDFSVRSTMDVGPLGTGTTMPIIAGVPALGAIVSANDGLSDPTTAYNPNHDPPWAYFSLPNVATGTWMTFISLGGYGLENDTVTIAATGSIYTFVSSVTFLDNAVTQGFVSGEVTGVTGLPLSVTVSPGGAGSDQTSSVSSGKYFLRVATGTLEVTANPGSLNTSYMAQTLSVAVDLGEVVNDVDFILSQGGRVTGFVTRDGTNALPGIAVAAIDANGYARDQQVSDVSGYFTTVGIPTGTYTMTPALDSIETSAPATQAVTVTAGTTIFSTTFTITGALGTITGAVSLGGRPISSGVLIVVSSNTLSGTPPVPASLSVDSLTGNPYYLVSSKEEGTYSVDVRGGSYLLYGYYTTISNSGAVTINSISLGAVLVTPGATVSGQDFAW